MKYILNPCSCGSAELVFDSEGEWEDDNTFVQMFYGVYCLNPQCDESVEVPINPPVVFGETTQENFGTWQKEASQAWNALHPNTTPTSTS